MSRICGIVRSRGSTSDDPALVIAMLQRLAHAGARSGRLRQESAATFGELRVAHGERGGARSVRLERSERIGPVLDGMLANADELRSEIRRAGHELVTGSPEELLLHGYRAWGAGLLRRVRGAFAFALWDPAEDQLLLGRDRVGIKPLYYVHDEAAGRLLFASEIKALFADPSLAREIDPARLPEYLTFRSIHGETTLYGRIREVAPGQLIRFGATGEVQRVWSAPEAPSADPLDVSEQAGAELIEQAVHAHLGDGAGIGSIMSGGLDSSLVSAIAARALGEGQLETLCVGFDDPRFDERPWARQVARRIGSRHHEIVVQPDEIAAELDTLTRTNDEPLTHPNAIPMYLLCRMASEELGRSVLLSGEGADEVFGGYDWYRTAYARERLRRLTPIAPAATLLPLGKLRTLGRILAPDYLLHANATCTGAAEKLLRHPGDPLGTRRTAWESSLPERDALFLYDQRTYLLPLLQRQDRMSSAAGIEPRVPFLDGRLLEWANRLPADRKLSGGARKALLKSIARGWLPEEILSRPKVGFAMPLGEWMRGGGPLADHLDRLRTPSTALRPHLLVPKIHEIIREHERGADHTDLLWSLIALDAWARSCLDADPGALSPSSPLALEIGPAADHLPI